MLDTNNKTSTKNKVEVSSFTPVVCLPDGGTLHFVDQESTNRDTMLLKDIEESLPTQYKSILKSKLYDGKSKDRVKSSIETMNKSNISKDSYKKQLQILSTMEEAPYVPQHGYVVIPDNPNKMYVRPMCASHQHSPKHSQDEQKRT
ncbi:hypothetical protein AKO1_007646 [Acrasis kona]|uniref:Uncharacterized protein n=1 Tax=Acrasis kona TaxID=1008807 RepID=A0AAW2YQ25_9EUKA